ncbi:restriction endonuclease subunit S [Streptococcus sp. HMSC061E03]|uniref:restriction endonuclease subunit S n=1 Tax=Streptococcus sp. HMSC061E03 TaxID=1739421 RepID=UPI0008A26B60|nr:restriction endonuclease subunit S [Streptococcus sp. HMSC061E03]
MKIESPIYRFEKFDKNWLFVKISDLASQFKTGGTPSTKEPTFWGGSIPWIQSSDIQKDILYGVIPQKFISEEGLQNSSAKLIPKNSIAIVTRVGVGKLAIIDQDYATSQDFLSLSDFDGDTQFLVYSIYRMLQKESTQLQGTSIKGITKEDLLSKKIGLPEIDEQSAIGSLFRTLDDLLASYKDNLANYQSLKATMLSKMFSKAGQAVPEIRLDGFEGEWRIMKLGDVLSELKSGLSRELSNDDIGLPVIRANNISDGNLNLDRDIKYWFKVDPKGANTANYFVKENDILVNFINSEAKMGTAAIVSREPDRETIYTTNILKLTVKEGYYPYFIYLMTFVQSYQNYIKSITKPAVNQASFTTVDFKKYEFLCPVFQEQQAIGAYFSNLDNLIAAHQEKISQLETLKKKLLQDMFI